VFWFGDCAASGFGVRSYAVGLGVLTDRAVGLGVLTDRTGRLVA
jgi:hypothetical protein